MSKITYFSYFLLIFALFFSFIFVKNANADVTYSFIVCNRNPGTTWQVWYQYLHNGLPINNLPYYVETRYGYFTDPTFAPLNCATGDKYQGYEQHIFNSGSTTDKVQWSTACVDPKVDPLYSNKFGNIYRQDVTYYTNSPAANENGYAGNKTLNSKGNNRGWVGYNEACKLCQPDNTCAANECGQPPDGCGGIKGTAPNYCGGCPYDNQTCNNTKCVGHFSCNHDTGNCVGDKNGGSTDQQACSANCVQWLPNLTITQFDYPGGDKGTVQKTAATITIKNNGKKAIPANSNFKVRIEDGTPASGGNNPQTWTVNQKVDVGESISNTFNVKTLPSTVNTFFAEAWVDYDGFANPPGDVKESNESAADNRTTDKYKTNILTSDVSGTIYYDTNLNGVLDKTGTDPDSKYASGARIFVVGNGTLDAISNNTTGKYIISNVPQQNSPLDIKLDTAATSLDTGESVVTAGSLSNPVTLPRLTADATGLDFLVKPAPFSISGGVIIDSDPIYGHLNAASENLAGNNKVDESYYKDTPLSITLDGPYDFNKTIPTDATGKFNATNLIKGTYALSISGIPTDYNLKYPNGTSTFGNLIVGPGCTLGTGNNYGGVGKAICTAGNNISNLLFGIQPKAPNPWFQAIGGDVRQDRVSNENQALAGNENSCSNAATPKYYTTVNSASLKDPGIIYHGGSDDLTKTNTNNWFIKNSNYSSIVRTSYKYLNNLLVTKGKLGTTDLATKCGTNGINSCDLTNVTNNGIYSLTGNVTISKGTTFTGNKNYVFLINGTLTISDDIIVDPGSTVIFAVNDNITIAPNVTNIEGLYSAGINFIANSNNSEVDDSLLTIKGSVVAGTNKTGGNLFNHRDLGPSQADGSKVCPSISFKYRPDFVLNAPEAIKYVNTNIREVSSGSPALPAAPTGSSITSFTAASNLIDYGTSTTLKWTSSNTTSCTGVNFTPDNKNNTTGLSTGPLTQDTTFILNCNGAGGNSSAQTIVKVKPKINYFSLVSTPILSGSPAKLKWSTSSNTASCNGGATFNAGAGNPTNSAGVTTSNISANKTFTLTCSNASASVSQDITLTSTSAYTEDSDNTVTIEVENSGARTKSDNGSAKTWAFNNSSALNTFYGSGYMAAQTDTNTSVTSNYPNNSPVMSYYVNFTSEGDYVVHNRSAAPDAGGDTVAFGVDNGFQDDAKIYIKDSASTVWKWRNDNAAVTGSTTINIPTKGFHYVNLWMREDGAKIDRISLNKVGNPTVTFKDTANPGPTESAIDTYFK